jgi:hypothetical protein
MVAKCANPTCNRQFHDLSKGRLFVLPPLNEYVVRLSDYCYWLCPECDATYTITRYGSEVIVIARERGIQSPPPPPYVEAKRREQPNMQHRMQQTA